MSTTFKLLHAFTRLISNPLCFVFFMSVAHGQVIDVSPRQNATHVPVDTSISVFFAEEMNAKTITDTTFRVWGSQSGIHTGNVSYDAALKKASILPQKPFVGGENVIITLTKGIRTSGGQFIKPFLWCFSTAVKISSARFPIQTQYAVGKTPNSICAADFDADDDVDLAVSAYASTNNLSILRNNGDGTFAAKQDYTVEGTPHSIAAADLDGDGDIDLVMGGNKGNVSAVFVATNNGDGTFKKKQDIIGGGRSVLLADWDGDGDFDLAVANANTVFILRNNGKGTFETKQAYEGGSSIATVDLDLDGDLDVAATSTSSKVFYMLKNNGDASFQTNKEYVIDYFPSFFAMADLDNDGDADVSIGNQYASMVYVSLNNGDGTFKPGQRYLVGRNPSAIAASDLNGDQDIDLATSNLSNSVSVLENNSNAIFQSVRNFAAGAKSEAISISDLDGDHDLDLAVVNNASHTVSVLFNKGEVFTTVSSLSFGEVYAGRNKDMAFKVYSTSKSMEVLSIVSNNEKFLLTSPTSLSLAPGDSVEVTVRYAPTTAMDDFGGVTVYSGNLAVERVTVRGIGITAVPIIFTNPIGLSFGNVTLGRVSDLILYISNKGASELSIIDIATASPYFAVSGRTVHTIQPDETKPVVVRFLPPFLGAQSDTLRIRSNDPINGVVRIPMNGTGVAIATQEISVRPAELQFDTVGVGLARSLVCQVHNLGAANLNINAMEIENSNFVIASPTSFALAPGDSKTVNIHFVPREIGLQNGTLRIANNDTNEDPLLMQLSGIGVLNSAVSNSTRVASTQLSLGQNYPNPFNPTTVIPYQLARSEWVTLRIYDVFGNEIETLVNEKQLAGSYSIKFDGRKWASGVYFYHLTAGAFRDSKKLLLIK